MRKRPFLLLACVFLAGVLYSSKLFFLPVAAVLLMLYAQPWKEKGVRRCFYAIGLPLFFFLGVFRISSENTYRERYLQELQDGQSVRLAGKVARIEQKSRCFYYYLTDCTVSLSGKNMSCNDVLAYCSSDDSSIGQILVLQGTISLFDEAANEGGFDARKFYRSQKIDFGLWVEEICSRQGRPDPYRNWLAGVRERLRQVIETSVEDDGVLSAMLLGEKGDLDAEVKLLYRQAGISHILAISGLHVSLLGIGLYRMLRHRCRMRYWSAAGCTAVFMVSYAVMSGSSISTRRAVGMLLIYLLAELLGRSYDLLNSLGLVVIVLLWENPFLIGYSGFLFSVAAVLGIGVGGNVFNEWRAVCLNEKEGKEKGRNAVEHKRHRKLAEALQKQLGGIWTSLAIQLFTLPLVAYFYYEIPVYAMVLNLLVLLSVSQLLGLAAIAAVSGLLFPAAAKLLLVPCGWILQIYQQLCHYFISLPGAQFISGKPAMWKIAVYYVLLSAGLYVMRCRTRREAAVKRETEKDGGRRSVMGRRLKQKLRFAGAVTVMLSVLLLPQKKEFEIDVLDVGQGDGIYLCTSDGITFFIDGGSSDVKNVGQYRILPFLKARGVKKISYWFVSHTDKDHISGLQEALESGYRIEHLVFARAVSQNEKTLELVRIAEAAGSEVLYMEEGDTLRTKQAKIMCLYPAEDIQSDDINDLSLVLRFEDNEISAMFAGDISSKVEKLLVEKGLCSEVDFYKADHHGSNYSNSMVFLQALSPRLTVASAGEGNRYGHPGAEAEARIEESGSRFLCTMDCGQVKINLVLRAYTAVRGGSD